MKKNEIIEFLKDLADDADIDETVKGNETLAKLFEKGLTIDDVKNFLDSNDDGKKYLQQYGDTRVTTGIDSWKKNNLQKEIDAEIKKRYPEKDPKELEMENMKKEIEAIRAESARKDLKNTALKFSTDKGLPNELLDFFIGQDEETTLKNLELYDTIVNGHINTKAESMMEAKLKGGYKPPTNTADPVDESKMTDAEWFAAQEQKNK